MAGKSYKKTAKLLTSSKGKKYAMGAGGLLLAGLIGAEVGDAFGDGGAGDFESGDAGEFSAGDAGDYGAVDGGAADNSTAYQDQVYQGQMSAIGDIEATAAANEAVNASAAQAAFEYRGQEAALALI